MKTKDAVAGFAALAQEHRLSIYRLLVQHGSTGLPAGAIGERLKLAPATLSFHLKELAQARLIVSRPDGRFIFYRPDFAAMNKLISYLCENCCQASDACAAPRSAIVRTTAKAGPPERASSGRSSTSSCAK